MSQWIRQLAVLLKDKKSAPRTPVTFPIMACKYNKRICLPSCTYTHKIKMKSKGELDTCEKSFSATALVIDSLVVKRHTSNFSHTAVKSHRWDLPQDLPYNILLPLLFSSLLPEPCICQHSPCNWKGGLPARQNEIRLSLQSLTESQIVSIEVDSPTQLS